MAIIQDKSLKDQLLLVDYRLDGPKDRGIDTPNTARVDGKTVDFHPMVRDNWGTADSLRGLMASYYTAYNGSNGPALYNYENSLLHLITGGNIAAGAFDEEPDGIGRLNKQVADPAGGTNIILSALFLDDDQSISFTRKVRAWNSYNAAPYSWYRDNFEEYIIGPNVTIVDRVTEEEATYGGLLNGGLNRAYFDHTSNYYLFSPIKNVRQASGLTTNVEPVYNYYVNSNPDYEDVVEKLQEYFIPNAYYLQLELQNTSSEFLAPYHRIAITMDGMIPWFNTTGFGSALETNSGVYYNLYSDNMTSIPTGFDPSIVKSNNGDTAVLYSDLAVLNEDSIIDESLPYYNKLTIGFETDRTTGDISSNASLMTQLIQNEDTKDFVDILQAYAIIKDKTTNASARFSTRKKVVSNSTTGDFAFSTSDTDYKELFTLHPDNQILFTAMLAPNGNNIDVDISGIADGPNKIQDKYGVRFLRDYFGKTEEGALELDTMSALHTFGFLSDNDKLESFKRTLKEVYENKSCDTETLLYIVEKYRGSAEEGLSEEPVQTFYISPKFLPSPPVDTTYYDTQIKYGQKYTYVFKKVILVFGNEYKYNNVEFDEPQVIYESQGTGVIYGPTQGFNLEFENKISIKALVVPYSFEGLTVSVVDKPPVSPDISFYPVKGVRNKVKILLNTNFGDFYDKPVEILDSDRGYIEEEYFGQTGENLTYNQIISQNKKIRYKSDDMIDRYELFRISEKPKSYKDFNNNAITVDPNIGTPGYFEDAISTNQKYYYCARAIDIHNNISNPTYIFELEMVDNNDQIYLRQSVFAFKASKPTYLKDGRRFIYIEPSFQQVALESEVNPPSNIDETPEDSILGVDGVNKVWTKTFKLRVTSKKTGKKMDLNLTFKNPGVTNAS